MCRFVYLAIFPHSHLDPKHFAFLHCDYAAQLMFQVKYCIELTNVGKDYSSQTMQHMDAYLLVGL